MIGLQRKNNHAAPLVFALLNHLLTQAKSLRSFHQQKMNPIDPGPLALQAEIYIVMLIYQLSLFAMNYIFVLLTVSGK
jgi:hypothetical protein